MPGVSTGAGPEQGDDTYASARACTHRAYLTSRVLARGRPGRPAASIYPILLPDLRPPSIRVSSIIGNCLAE